MAYQPSSPTANNDDMFFMPSSPTDEVDVMNGPTPSPFLAEDMGLFNLQHTQTKQQQQQQSNAPTSKPQFVPPPLPPPSQDKAQQKKPFQPPPLPPTAFQPPQQQPIITYITNPPKTYDMAGLPRSDSSQGTTNNYVIVPSPAAPLIQPSPKQQIIVVPYQGPTQQQTQQQPIVTPSPSLLGPPPGYLPPPPNVSTGGSPFPPPPPFVQQQLQQQVQLQQQQQMNQSPGLPSPFPQLFGAFGTSPLAYIQYKLPFLQMCQQCPPAPDHIRTSWCVFVGQLPPYVSSGGLFELLRILAEGVIPSSVVLSGRKLTSKGNTIQHKGPFAHVYLASPEDMEKIIELDSKTIFDDRVAYITQTYEEQEILRNFCCNERQHFRSIEMELPMNPMTVQHSKASSKNPTPTQSPIAPPEMIPVPSPTLTTTVLQPTAQPFYPPGSHPGVDLPPPKYEDVVGEGRKLTPPPLATMTPPSTEDKSNKSTCVACQKRPRTHVFGPCGHLICCDECTAAMTECFLCKETITIKLHVRYN
eukprot:PhF_6_TR33715/c1_g1_i1/m.49483